MGRREKELDPAAGAVQRFAHDLRELRRGAGSPAYRQLARDAGYSAPTLSAAAAGERLPSLPVLLAYVDACGGDPAGWERRWRAAVAAQATARAPEDDGTAPYRGLARYGPGDRQLFFGRDALIDELATLVAEHRVCAVTGASGSGKSSLLRAGLVPRLREHPGPPGTAPAAVRILTPGADPGRTHAARLLPAGGEGDTVVVVDQFEEVFSLCQEADRRREFVRQLLAARESGSRLRIVLGVRADFFGRLAAIRPLAEALHAATLLVGPMSPARLREAVVGPASAEKLIVERALTARIVADVADEPGGLPLMSHALLELWRRRSGRTLTLAAYDAIGGVQGALAHTAEEVLDGFDEDRAALARAMLLRLIAPGEGTTDTRRPADRAELVQSAAAAEVLERLVRARLLTADGSTVELAHEALITGWPRLSGWVDDSRERLRLHRLLTAAAQSWSALDHDPGALYRGTRLTAAQEEFTAGPAGGPDEELTAVEGEFLAASIAEDERRARTAARVTRRLRSLSAALAVLLCLALGAGLLAWQQSRVSSRQRDDAEARRIAALSAELRYAQPRTAMRLGLAAYRIADLPETRAALAGAAAQRELGMFAEPTEEEPTEEEVDGVRSSYTPDMRTFHQISRNGSRRWDTATGRRLTSYPGLPHGAGDIQDVSPDGRAVVYEDGGRLRVWQLDEGRPGGNAFGQAEDGEALFSPSGRLLLVDRSEYPEDKDVQVWDPDGRQLLDIRQGDAGRNPVISPDDRLLAICPAGARPQVWDIRERRMLHTGFTPEPPGNLCDAEQMQFTPDGRGLAFTTEHAVRVWDVRTGRERPRLKGEELFDATFSEDGTYAATFDRGAQAIQLWRTADGSGPVMTYPLGGTATGIGDIALDTEQGVLRYSEGSPPSAAVRTISLGGVLGGEWQQEPLATALFSPDGRTLATTTVPDGGGGEGVQLRDGASGRPEETLPGMTCPWKCGTPMAFSQDGRVFAHLRGPEETPSVSVRGTAGRGPAPYDMPVHGALDIALTQDGRSLVVDRGDIELWDVRGGDRRTVHGDRQDSLLAVAPSGRWLLTDRHRRVALPAGEGRRAIKGADSWVTAVAFSPDSRYLALADHKGEVTLWDGKGRGQLAVLTSASADPRRMRADDADDFYSPALAFSADGRTLAVGDTDGSLRLWRTDSPGASPAHHAPVDGPVLGLAFADGDTELRVTTPHTPLRTRELAPERLAEAVCERAGGGLTAAEWARHLRSTAYRSTC